MRSTPPHERLPHVMEVRRGKNTWLYYRRGGRRWPLPGPEGSSVHILAHQKIHDSYATLRETVTRSAPGTLDAAVTAYLRSADYKQLSSQTQADYRRVLDKFRGAFGPWPMTKLNAAFWDEMRDKYVSIPIAWNGLRSRMKEVFRRYRKDHPGELPENPLQEVKRLKIAKSDQNRPWPLPVLEKVAMHVTQEFLALLVGYVLTAQRGGDVTKFRPAQYDRANRTIRLEQGKTDKDQVLHVPATLGDAIDLMAGRHPDRLFVTPRGRAWTTANAQETLATALRQLELPRYTLHGLRATGPVALKMLGMENRRIRELTGHDSDANLEVYLRGAGGYEMAHEAQEALEGVFGGTLAKALSGGNRTKAAGATGRAAAKIRQKQVQTDVQTANSPEMPTRRKPRKE
nr:tyrosine-type recombinase/integrase [uncultured Roseococcus sp.]